MSRWQASPESSARSTPPNRFSSIGAVVDFVGDIERRLVLVTGRVQGVYFRDGVRREAAAAGVCGSARNLADGRVEVVLEGELPALEQVIAWCRVGPVRARVDAVEISAAPVEHMTGFVIG